MHIGTVNAGLEEAKLRANKDEAEKTFIRKVEGHKGCALEPMGQTGIPCHALDYHMMRNFRMLNYPDNFQALKYSKMDGYNDDRLVPAHYFVLDDVDALPPYILSGFKEEPPTSDDYRRLYNRTGGMHEIFLKAGCLAGFEQHEASNQLYLFIPDIVPHLNEKNLLVKRENIEQLSLFLALLSTEGKKVLLDLKEDQEKIIEAYERPQAIWRSRNYARGIMQEKVIKNKAHAGAPGLEKKEYPPLAM